MMILRYSTRLAAIRSGRRRAADRQASDPAAIGHFSGVNTQYIVNIELVTHLHPAIYVHRYILYIFVRQ